MEKKRKKRKEMERKGKNKNKKRKEKKRKETENMKENQQAAVEKSLPGVQAHCAVFTKYCLYIVYLEIRCANFFAHRIMKKKKNSFLVKVDYDVPCSDARFKSVL